MTNAEAKALCPRTCIDCCCEVHHWGVYGPEEDENGNVNLDDDTMYSCKHCPARLSAEEICVLCKAALIDHGELNCPEGNGQFLYDGEPKRVCTQSHPWDTSIKCAFCGQLATCFGAYGGASEKTYACDKCCGHGNEDGHCFPLAADSAKEKP